MNKKIPFFVLFLFFGLLIKASGQACFEDQSFYEVQNYFHIQITEKNSVTHCCDPLDQFALRKYEERFEAKPNNFISSNYLHFNAPLFAMEKCKNDAHSCVLNCTYYFLRLSVLKSQAHPPTV